MVLLGCGGHLALDVVGPEHGLLQLHVLQADEREGEAHHPVLEVGWRGWRRGWRSGWRRVTEREREEEKEEKEEKEEMGGDGGRTERGGEIKDDWMEEEISHLFSCC